MRLLIHARNRSVAVEAGRIVEAVGGFDRVLDFPDAEIAPGLINAHDHLHRNHYGRPRQRRCGCGRGSAAAPQISRSKARPSTTGKPR